MKFWLRCAANALAIFLGLYLLDSLAEGGFLMREVWVAVLLALLLGLLNSLVRPLRRVRNRPFNALFEAVLTVLGNTLALQVFLWARAPLTARSFGWVLLAAAFVSLLAGLINWLIGFKSREKARTVDLENVEARPRVEPLKASRSQSDSGRARRARS